MIELNGILLHFHFYRVFVRRAWRMRAISDQSSFKSISEIFLERVWVKTFLYLFMCRNIKKFYNKLSPNSQLSTFTHSKSISIKFQFNSYDFKSLMMEMVWLSSLLTQYSPQQFYCISGVMHQTFCFIFKKNKIHKLTYEVTIRKLPVQSHV